MRCKTVFLMLFAAINIPLPAIDKTVFIEDQIIEPVDIQKMISDLKNKIDYLDILMKKSDQEKLAYSVFLQLQKNAKLKSQMIDLALLYQQANSYVEFLHNQDLLQPMIDEFNAKVLAKIIVTKYQIKQLKDF